MKSFNIRVEFPDKFTPEDVWQQIGLELDVKGWEKIGVKFTAEP